MYVHTHTHTRISPRHDTHQGCGAAPAGLSLASVAAAGVTGTELPVHSALCVTVPGAVALWEDALKAWGRQGLSDVLAPAIELAEEGFPVSPVTAAVWAAASEQLLHHHASGDGRGCELLTAEGKAPCAGEVWRNPQLAATYRRIAQDGAAQGAHSLGGPKGDRGGSLLARVCIWC